MSVGNIKGRFNVIVNSLIHPSTTIWSFNNIYDSTIGENCKIGSFNDIGGAKIGNHCLIETGVSISPGTVVGDHVLIGPGVRVANDKHPNAKAEWNRAPVIIEDYVSIGIAAVILPGVRIGHGSFVAGAAVVTKNMPSDSFAMGSPAHVVSKKVFRNGQE